MWHDLFRILALLFALSVIPILLRVIRFETVQRSCEETNARSQASNPGELPLCEENLRRLCPELYPDRRALFAWWDSRYGARAAQRFEIADQLIHGDTRAAVVLLLEPLLIAAYSDDLDAVVLLRFPFEFVAEYGLTLHDRLVTVNRYSFPGNTARDIVYGPGVAIRYSNIHPFIGDFLSEDTARLQFLKSEIEAEEWERAQQLGEAYLQRFGLTARDGRPTQASNPANVAYSDA